MRGYGPGYLSPADQARRSAEIAGGRHRSRRVPAGCGDRSTAGSRLATHRRRLVVCAPGTSV